MGGRCGTIAGRQVRSSVTGGVAAVLVIVAVVIAAGWTLARAIPLGGLAAGPVYSVGQLRAALALRPRAWLGRTVRVYAVAAHVRVQYCPYHEDACVGEMPVLADTGATGAVSLPLVWGLSDPLRAWLRRFPLIARAAPPQVPHWGRPAIYRVALRLLPGPRRPAVYAAALLDASPLAGL